MKLVKTAVRAISELEALMSWVGAQHGSVAAIGIEAVPSPQ
ncbi:hypothetical protein R5H32_15290 [Defluviimonas sp. D31]|nr:hypothetical protein [Defluviimonas sp. D31]MDW4550725.1 hypothetical protein [Defluviimonas sp. D31]